MCHSKKIESQSNMNPKKQTKIVATIGPATETKETLKAMIEAGMNVARFNTKHSTPKWHLERIKRVKQVSSELEVPVAVLVDLQGPEIRIDLPNKTAFSLAKGEEVEFTPNRQQKTEKIIYIPENIVHYFSKGSLILTDDGACEFIVKKINDGSFTAQAIGACRVEDRKTMNTPGTILGMPSITDRDRQYLAKIDSELIDYVGLSFVRDLKDIQNLEAELEKNEIEAKIISKIENESALDNLAEIIRASDGIMIARGDLGIEVDYQELTFWQKKIIEDCRDAATPVITATQMLESMTEHPRPTRAEVSDVANAIYDGTDAIMLSGETTIGKYPIEAVRTQTEIAQFNEQHANHKIKWPKNDCNSLDITSNAANLLKHSAQKIDSIVCLTETGHTARLLSRFRPKLPIDAVTHNEDTYRALTLSYGVQPKMIDFPEGRIDFSPELITAFVEAGVVRPGETVLVVHGSVWKKPGLTNTMSLINIEE